MPHEKINHLPPVALNPMMSNPALPQITVGEGESIRKQVVVEWNRIGWVDIAIYPDGWKDTGYAWRVPLVPQDLDLLIKTLKRARRQAYGDGQRYLGYEDIEPHGTQPLFDPKIGDEIDESVTDRGDWWNDNTGATRMVPPRALRRRRLTP